MTLFPRAWMAPRELILAGDGPQGTVSAYVGVGHFAQG